MDYVGQRRDRGPHERNGACIPRVPRNVARRAGLRTVEHRKVVLMRVAEEDGGDRVGREPTHDLEKEIRRLVKRLGACPAGQYVSQDPYALALPLCGKELVRQETEHATKVGVRRVNVIEHVGIVPKLSLVVQHVHQNSEK